MARNMFKRYFKVFIVLLLIILLYMVNKDLGLKAINITSFTLKEMLLILPPIFVLLGLLDVWVPRDTMVKFMGEGSGLKGVLLSIFIGSAAAGPLYGAFPVAAVFMSKGVKFSNILIFIGAWSTTKIPMFLFEMASLGQIFAITRLILNIPGIIVIAYALGKIMKKEEVDLIYDNAIQIINE